MFELLEAGLLAGAETALNRLLALDPASPARLRDLAGARVQLESTRPRLCVCVLVHEGGVLLGGRAEEGDADAVIRGPAFALAGLLGDREVTTFYGRDIEVRGDLEKARELQRLLAGLNVDWEYYLSRVLGDVPTQAFSEALRSGGELLRQGSRSLMMDLEEYLHEERRLFPGRNEVDAFQASLQELRMDVERLAARVERLDKKIKPPV